MTWLSSEETDARIQKLNHPELLFQLYALSLFVHKAFYAPEFEPSEDWCEVVVLSPEGDKLLSDLHKNGIQFSNSYEYFTLLRLFNHHDILIDFEKTDIVRLLDLLKGINSSRKGRWPYVFGNSLYNKFNDIYDGNRTDLLDAESAEKLLSDTPQGVFQIGKVLSGPLGFVESSEERIILPTLRLPLWHCSDPGCKKRHIVQLEQHKSKCTRTLKIFVRYILDHLGPPSEWHMAILRIYRRGKWPNGRPYIDLPAVLADCIIDHERQTLCLKALRTEHNAHLCGVVRDTKGLKGSPDTIVAALSPEEQQQLLLLLPDRDIVNLIDELVCQKEIKIFPSELRESKTYAPISYRDNRSKLSSLGIQSTGHPPVIELAALIWNTYEELGITKDLAWRVRGHAGPTIRHSVMDFIKAHGPETAVRDLILPSRDVTTKIAQYLIYQICTEEEEDKTCNRLLWKFGFNLARYEDEYQILRKRIKEFRERALQIPTQPNEEERAKMRSIGVNLFVSVEQFLENVLCYNVWLLTSDHFTGTNFSFTKKDALSSVSRVLGGQIESGNEVLKWSENGANTLGVLLGYLQAFRNWLKQRISADKSNFMRNLRDYPHYAEDTLLVFPFEHVELWADVSTEIMAVYIDVFEKFCVQIVQAELPIIRNGLDHKREENAFPNADKLLACVSRLQQVVDTADSRRLIPKLFWCVKKEQDANGNICTIFADYNRMTVSLLDPSPVYLRSSKLFEVPYLIAPFDFLNQPNSTLIFRVSPYTEYREYWKDYPRSRIIPLDRSQEDAQISPNIEVETID